VSGRFFVVGDIHGCYDQLMRELDRVSFDRSKDILCALGDLADRGPRSWDVVQLLRQPWFRSIKGNHEVMLEAHHLGQDDDGFHCRHGGLWFTRLTPEQRQEAYDLVHPLPLAMTVETPSGRRIGLVHGEVCGNDWDRFLKLLDEHRAAGDAALWSKSRAKNRAAYDNQIAGVDMVYVGHTPMRAPVQAGNIRWIDTGCYDSGVLTLEELV